MRFMQKIAVWSSNYTFLGTALRPSGLCAIAIQPTNSGRPLTPQKLPAQQDVCHFSHCRKMAPWRSCCHLIRKQLARVNPLEPRSKVSHTFFTIAKVKTETTIPLLDIAGQTIHTA